jgi:hypothetical protein
MTLHADISNPAELHRHESAPVPGDGDAPAPSHGRPALHHQHSKTREPMNAFEAAIQGDDAWLVRHIERELGASRRRAGAGLRRPSHSRATALALQRALQRSAAPHGRLPNSAAAVSSFSPPLSSSFLPPANRFQRERPRPLPEAHRAALRRG